MTDLPYYEPPTDDNEKEMKVNKENAAAIANHINSLI